MALRITFLILRRSENQTYSPGTGESSRVKVPLRSQRWWWRLHSLTRYFTTLALLSPSVFNHSGPYMARAGDMHTGVSYLFYMYQSLISPPPQQISLSNRAKRMYLFSSPPPVHLVLPCILVLHHVKMWPPTLCADPCLPNLQISISSCLS